MKREINLLFMINVLSAIGYSLIAPLFPSLALQKGVSEFLIGLTFSSFAISNVFTIPLTPRFIKHYGRINLMYFSLALESGCTLIFAFIELIDNPFLFPFLSILSRLLHGLGAALSSTLVYSIAASISDEDEIKTTMGYMELGYSLGLTIGPVIASLFYHYFGYCFPFYFCSLLMLSCIPFIKLIEVKQDECEEIEFFKILLNPKIVPTFLAIVIDMISTTFFLPVFAHHLIKTFGLSLEQASIFFIINMISYFIVLQYLNEVNNVFGLKLTMTIGLMVNSIAVLFIHPISFLPQSWVVIVIGLLILGMTGAFITIPGIIDFMDSIKMEMNINESSANDVASALYNFGINCGEAIGPTFGGIITNIYKLETACKGTSILNLVYASIFALINYKIIKTHFYNSPKDQGIDTEYGEITYNDIDSTKNRMKDRVCYTPKYRAYSFSSLNSKRNSIVNTNQ